MISPKSCSSSKVFRRLFVFSSKFVGGLLEFRVWQRRGKSGLSGSTDILGDTVYKWLVCLSSRGIVW